MKILQNAIECPDGTIMLSSNNYERQVHLDRNGKKYEIGGGKVTLERSGEQDYKELSITEKHTFEFAFKNLLWLSNGVYKKLPELSSNHLESIYKHGSSSLLHKFVIAEILTRRNFWPKRKTKG